MLTTNRSSSLPVLSTAQYRGRPSYDPTILSKKNCIGPLPDDHRSGRSIPNGHVCQRNLTEVAATAGITSGNDAATAHDAAPTNKHRRDIVILPLPARSTKYI